MEEKNVLLILLLVAVGISYVNHVDTNSVLCVGENQKTTNGQCCLGLEAKHYNGWTQDTFCVKPACEVKCLYDHYSYEGLYTVCNNENEKALMIIGCRAEKDTSSS